MQNAEKQMTKYKFLECFCNKIKTRSNSSEMERASVDGTTFAQSR